MNKMTNTPKTEKTQKAIAVFDSGIGGLTVLKALKKYFPNESYIYVGDTARLPYGTKSKETVIKYSEAITRCVLKHDPKALVVACNTASTYALDAVQTLAKNIPVIGMVKPAAQAAVKITRNNHIALIATQGTISSGAYKKEIRNLNQDMTLSEAPCQMLVALAEEGWNDRSDAITREIIKRYLDPLFNKADAPDTLILGCTHFPVFSETIGEFLGSEVALINTGEEAAQKLTSILETQTSNSAHASTRFMATDAPEKFAQNAAKFFDHRLNDSEVELIDL